MHETGMWFFREIPSVYRKESIVVNDRMETSVPNIYAAGDAVQVKHYVTGNDALIPLAGPANKQGRIIADNICGGDSHYLGSQGSFVIKVFDMTAATTGMNETNAKKSGLPQHILLCYFHIDYFLLAESNEWNVS